MVDMIEIEKVLEEKVMDFLKMKSVISNANFGKVRVLDVEYDEENNVVEFWVMNSIKNEEYGKVWMKLVVVGVNEVSDIEKWVIEEEEVYDRINCNK